MCDNCIAAVKEASTVVDAIVHAEKHTRMLYPHDSNEEHCVRLAMTIIETQVKPTHFGPEDSPFGAMTVESLRCLAMQYATTVQRLIALHELSGLAIPE